MKVYFAAGFFLLSFFALSQTNPTDYLILSNGDTLSGVDILDKRKYSNEDEILVFDGYLKEKILAASDLRSASIDGTFYVSENVNARIKKLVNYPVNGPVAMGVSVSARNNQTFYFKKDGKIERVNDSATDMEAFFQEYLEDYASFKQGYKRKVFFQKKSIADFVSAYNAFTDPSKYKRVRHKFPPKISIGISATFDIARLSFPLLTGGSYDKGNGFSAGAWFHSDYSALSSIYAPLLVSNTSFSANDGRSSANLSSVNFEPFLAFTLHRKGLNTLKAGIGPTLRFVTGGQIKSINVWDFTQFGSGFNANLLYEMKRKSIIVRYNWLSMKASRKTTFFTQKSFRATVLNFAFVYWIN